jgi:Fic family protein
MAPPQDKLARSLALLKELQDNDVCAIRTRDLTRTHRERLLKNGFIQVVMRGWYIPSRPDEAAGDSTAWYATFWNFCAAYLNGRLGADWCLAPEQSISLHTGNWTVPKQLLVRSPKGRNKPTQLLHETSIFDVRLKLPEKQDIEDLQSQRTLCLPAALISCAPGYFSAQPVEMRSALSMITNASEVLSRLLAGGHSKVAGRLAGAFRNIGRDQIANNIVQTMRAAGYTVNETDPFEDKPAIAFNLKETSPYVNRLRMHWEAMREPILRHFPAPPAKKTDNNAYLQHVDDIYVADAYHSLSIEGYRVSHEMIERVRSGDWNPDREKADREHHNAMAARGYWQAFQAVKESVKQVLDQANPGEVLDKNHSEWYRELFGPGVTGGIIQAADLAGYRDRPVYIRCSQHVPPNYEAVRELMPAFFELLKDETEPSVRVVLGHFMFVYIHPYVDGNGRMGRFLMNVMLASGGYSWIVIPVERRAEYMAALEAASVHQDIKPFTKFLASLL